ncbi:helix-hairpin-helix domain-containing protein [Enterococcus viikkiensis]|uniref:Helix-hairpin-helix domain-containing protein n=1 Tax=Enterococcus viikkiensis TaxID=930854 RepID=A0ABU3FQ85_9ENTE|nr:helix-hairpin-helix domain-containing protein [Enterococcus viikkiensis]MDT2828140.1 helix-hairpin-helix domain-containing protein [Enterococcus viikkiensis]
MQHYLKKYPYLFGLPIVIGGLVVTFLFLRAPAEETTAPELFSTTERALQETTTTTEQEWYVDVKGAVKKTGMYRITQGMRLMDAIDLAGGFTSEADQNQVNFSKLLTDQEIIYVPKVGEDISVIGEVSQGKSSTTTASGAAEKININTADLTELQQLTGIGEKKAADIIKYREENGSFRAVEDLTKVSGIGEKTLENLKDSITI